MSWDVPTGEKCPQCSSAMVQTLRGGSKCSNKDCDYRIKGTAAPKSAKGNGVVMADDFTPPPLLDEPQYFEFDEQVGFFPPDLED